ncbi:RimJ/RimL family protein N-acetyltransferase [Rathayibacter agropyri]
MMEFKISLRAAGRADAETIATLADRGAAGSRAGIRDASAVDVEAIASTIAQGAVQYFVVSTQKGKDIGFAEWRWVGQRVARNASIGVIISDASLWAQGFGAEAIDAVIEELFYTHDANRVEFVTAMSNYPMVNMLARRGGPVLDGILREYYYVDGRREDALVWSILRTEFDEFSTALPDRVKRLGERTETIARSRVRIAEYVALPESTAIGFLPIGEVSA